MLVFRETSYDDDEAWEMLAGFGGFHHVVGEVLYATGFNLEASGRQRVRQGLISMR